ncbi:MAG: type II CRISPR RNA-guided endonuclease Cas9 [Armatimonadetes bacterium]|nr:type II CRISPR RNA-guided endonuclease Cas9 [Armatimonadota bacterium]
MFMQVPYVLSLDLGTSSVGWSVLAIDKDRVPKDILALGVRHFQEVMDGQGKELKNAKRRAARSLRRNLDRRRRRKIAILTELKNLNLIDSVDNPFAESEDEPYAPYRLRAEGLERRLEPYELARAFFHLQRRGFKSNRGAKLASLEQDEDIQELLAGMANEVEEEDENKEETGKILKRISELEEEMGNLTLGQFFWQELQAGRKVRTRHTRRSMVEKEFERLWEFQSQFHDGLGQAAKVRLHHALFYQRPLRPQKFLVGNCSLEPTKKRGAKATLVAQRFRIWSDLANLEITDKETGERFRLSQDQKAELANELDLVKELSWTKIAKLLKLKKAIFNLEATYKNGLAGNITSIQMRRRCPELWESLSHDGKDELIETILTSDDRGKLYKTLKEKYLLPVKTAYDLAVNDLVDGYASLSSKAMSKMLEHLQLGLTRQEAQEAAGYKPWELEIAQQNKISAPPDPKEFTSPRVRKALNQVRKVANALVREYGNPTCIRIEMVRDMSLTKREKAEWLRVQGQGRKENEEADKFLKQIGLTNPTRTDRYWYRLAKQCNWRCPYSDKAIGQDMTAMSQFEIEHIVPYDLCFDDSFNNLTLCHRDYNAKKGKKTPFQAFGHTAEWERMKERISQLKGPGTGKKKSLFLREDDPDIDKMISRQLTETKWITRAAAQYLRPLVEKATDIESTKGSATAMLRSHWGLMSILDEVAGRTGESGEKNRDDLRHHTVDAVAVAFTTRSVFQRISNHRKIHADGTDAKIIPLSNDVVPPAPDWLGPRLKEQLAKVVPSHETTRQILDAFHQETAYGKRKGGGYHVRKQLTSLTDKELDRIVDSRLRQAVLATIENYAQRNGGKRDTAAALADGVPYGNTVAKRARIEARITESAPVLATPREHPTKFFALGNNHHVAIFESPDGKKRKGVFVSMIDAAKRVRPHPGERKRPIVNTYDLPGWRFVMWLCANDAIADEDGVIYRVQKLDPTNDRMVFRLITAGSVTNDEERLIKSINVLRCTKLEVDPIGRVREVSEGVV